MKLELTQDQRAMVQTVRDLAQEKFKGRVHRWQDGTFPFDNIKELAEIGVLGMAVPEALGGIGADAVSYALALMEIAAGDGAVSTMMSVHNAPFCAILARHATPAQQDRWLRPAAQGAYVGAFALTEPQAGSDAGALRSRARRDGNGYVLDGEKQFITSARICGAMIAFAATDPATGKRGLSAFCIPAGAPGLMIGAPERKMGQRASDTCAVRFSGVRIGEDHRIGAEGQGLSIALSALETGRIGIAAQSVGMAQAALAVATGYAQDRMTFGKPIGQHQAVAFRLADMDVQVEAARQLVLNAARVKDAGQPCLREASIAKLFASEMAERVVSAAIQTLGGYGYLEDFPLERIARDVRVCQIYEGTSDVQRINISRALLGEGRR